MSFGVTKKKPGEASGGDADISRDVLEILGTTSSPRVSLLVLGGLVLVSGLVGFWATGILSPTPVHVVALDPAKRTEEALVTAAPVVRRVATPPLEMHAVANLFDEHSSVKHGDEKHSDEAEAGGHKATAGEEVEEADLGADYAEASADEPGEQEDDDSEEAVAPAAPGDAEAQDLAPDAPEDEARHTRLTPKTQQTKLQARPTIPQARPRLPPKRQETKLQARPTTQAWPASLRSRSCFT